MRADQRKFHYIYKITRTDGSGKYYIGMHSTDDLEDGYFGSGRLIARSIRKYGKEKHSKEILEFLPTRLELKARERTLVNEEILDDPLCMNLQLGGGGGFTGAEHRQKFITSPRTAKLRGTPQASEMSRKAGETRRKNGTTAKGNPNLSLRHVGTKWMNNGTKALKVPKDEVEKYLASGYALGML